MRISKLLLGGLIVAFLTTSCHSEPKDDPGSTTPEGQDSAVMTVLNATLADETWTKVQLAGTRFLWSGGDALSVYTTENAFKVFMLKNGGNKTEGIFGTELKSSVQVSQLALYPASSDYQLSEDGKHLKVTLPSIYNYDSSSKNVFFLGKIKKDGDKAVNLYSLTAFYHIHYDELPLGTAIIRLNTDRRISGEMTVNLEEDRPAVAVGESAADKVLIYLNDIPESGLDAYVPLPVGTYGSIQACLLDGNSTPIRGTETIFNNVGEVSRGEVLDAPIPVPQLHLEWLVDNLPIFAGNFPAIDGEGNVYSVNGENLYKITQDGQIAWTLPVGSGGSRQRTIVALEPDGSTIYVCGGENGEGTGKLLAVTSAGTVKWELPSSSFPTENVSFYNVCPVVGEKNIYVPYGTYSVPGTLIAVDKQTGKLVSYLALDAAGSLTSSGTPEGAECFPKSLAGISGAGLSADGDLCYSCRMGMVIVRQSDMDNPPYTDVQGRKFALFSYFVGETWNFNTAAAGVACTTVDGKAYAIASLQNGSGAKAGQEYGLRTFAGCSTAGVELGNIKEKDAASYTVSLEKLALQNDGGVIVGPAGEVIISRKAATGKETVTVVEKAGGLTAMNLWTKNTLWSYNVEQNVSGAPAVDNKGCLHFVTKDGQYFILSFAGGSPILASRVPLTQLLQESGALEEGVRVVDTWSSLMIGDDGRIYVAAHLNGESSRGAILCLSYPETTGYGTALSPWPMKCANPRHTCRQSSN